MILRCYRPGDGFMLADALNDSYEHLVRFIPWSRRVTSDDEGEQRALDYRTRFLQDWDYNLAVVSPDDTRFLGNTDLRPEQSEQQSGASLGSAEIGMWIRADAAHGGLGTHVLSSLLYWGFSAWPFERLVWKCDVDNRASMRVAKKCWMRWAGVVEKDHMDGCGNLRDSHCFEALRSEWQTGYRQKSQHVCGRNSGY